jgi:hypothetical protein
MVISDNKLFNKQDGEQAFHLGGVDRGPNAAMDG